MIIRRPTPAPRAFRRVELARFGVDVVHWHRQVLRCRKCSTRWRARQERYIAYWWCPMGCNRTALDPPDPTEPE
jgi:hypothetical protein